MGLIKQCTHPHSLLTTPTYPYLTLLILTYPKSFPAHLHLLKVMPHPPPLTLSHKIMPHTPPPIPTHPQKTSHTPTHPK